VDARFLAFGDFGFDRVASRAEVSLDAHLSGAELLKR
jgi:hypothetical protein